MKLLHNPFHVQLIPSLRIKDFEILYLTTARNRNECMRKHRKKQAEFLYEYLEAPQYVMSP